MLFAIEYRFGDEVAAARDGVRGDHLTYLKDAGTRLKLAGPLIVPNDGSDDEEVVTGSLLVLDADSLTAAQLFTQHDPYYKAGIVDAVNIKAFRGVLGDWVL